MAAGTIILAASLTLPPAHSGALGRPGGAVVFAFDDGCDTHKRAAEMLEARGARGTFFVLTGGGSPDASCSAYLTSSEMGALAKRGHEIGSHSISHPHLTTLTDAELARELTASQATLRAWTGQSVLHFAYPYGETDARIRSIISDTYSTARLFERARPGLDISFASRMLDTDDRTAIPSIGIERSTTLAEAKAMIDLSRARGTTLILVFHDLSDAPAPFDVTPTMFEAILDHARTSGAPILTLSQALGDVDFAPRNGNAWWVQTSVKGPDASRVTLVEARSEGGPWTTLPQKSWGDHAASIRVAPGATVEYRATLGDGRLVRSCPFAHPGALCAQRATATPAPFSAQFKNVRGNGWWVEADVTAAGPEVTAVQARVDAGAWTPLDLRWYGSWAKSIRAPAGSLVEFRAEDAAGAAATSPAYAWPPR